MLLLLLACSSAPVPSPVAREARAPHARKEARTITVDCAGGADFTTLAEAIDEADSGDTVEVAPCTYPEAVDFKGRAIRIVGTGGAAVTTIQAPGGVPAVRVHRGEGPGTVLEGFTVTGGGGELEPAIEEQFSSLTLRDVVLTGNGGTTTVYARSAMLTLERVTMDGTNTASAGWLVEGRRGQLVVKDSTIRCGDVPMGYSMEHGAAFLDGATFDCPGATAAWIFHSNGRVQRSRVEGLLLVENESTSQEPTRVEGSLLLGGVSALQALLRLDNTVVSGAGISANEADVTVRSSVVTGATCGVTLTRSDFTSGWTDYWGNTTDVCGEDSPVGSSGNFASDPLFTDAAAGDYTLQAGSPCADAGSTDADDLDPDGSRNDVGAYGGPFSLGGGW